MTPSPAPRPRPDTGSPRPRSRRRAALAVALSAGLALAGTGIAGAVPTDTPGATDSTAAHSRSADTPAPSLEEFRRGPDPTAESARAERGTFAVKKTTVQGNGFKTGTVYYPTDTSEGTFGAVAVVPGFFESQSALSWYGTKLASHGFVVVTIDTFSLFDQPTDRGRQLLAALDYVAKASPSEIRSRVDPDRLAVMGHSMGGGGAANAARARPSLLASIPLSPWTNHLDFGNVTVPTMVVAAENDGIAPVADHAEPLYESLRSARESAYLNLANANHFTVNGYTPTVAGLTLSWLKRYVDNDTRYEQFLCPPPKPGGAIREYRDTCPAG